MHYARGALFMWITMACAGCPPLNRQRDIAAPAPTPPPNALPDRPPVRFDHVVLGRSVQGRDLVMTVLRGGPESVLVIGGIHGNEQTSVDVASALLDLLREQPELARGRTVAIYPNSNPDGYARNSRFNANQIDVNRNFAATNFKPALQAGLRSGTAPLSEPESRAIVRAIESIKPSLLISIHSIARGRHCNNWDGPAEHLAALMSKHNGYPPTETMGYPTPGSLGSYAGIDRQIPMITLELPRDAPGAQAWGENRAALLAAIEQASRSPAPLSTRTH
jgi:predicted deacylase